MKSIFPNKFFFCALCILSTYLFFSFSCLASSNSEWKVIKSKNLAILPGAAVMTSIRLSCSALHDREQEATIDALIFSEKNYRLQVIDNPKQERSLFEMMQSGAFVAGMNGGYFHPDSRPLGLLMHDGTILHEQEKARLLSGIMVSNNHYLAVKRVGESLPKTLDEALQAGPFLIDNDSSVAGLESTRIAWRSFLATDGHGRWVMGKISPVTLAEASHLLLAARSALFLSGSIQRALNLDGGSSTALWVDMKPEAFSFNENVHVRNFLGLRLR